MQGSAKMVLENGKHPQEVNKSSVGLHTHIHSHRNRHNAYSPFLRPSHTQLKDSVCSPAGTAIQGIRLMEREGFRGIMMDAVHAASKRALELSRLQNNGEEKDVYVKR